MCSCLRAASTGSRGWAVSLSLGPWWSVDLLVAEHHGVGRRVWIPVIARWGALWSRRVWRAGWATGPGTGVCQRAGCGRWAPHREPGPPTPRGCPLEPLQLHLAGIWGRGGSEVSEGNTKSLCWDLGSLLPFIVFSNYLRIFLFFLFPICWQWKNFVSVILVC